jgi:hypothetical protein
MKPLLSEIVLAVTIVCLISSSAPAMTHNTFRCPNGSLIQINDKLSTVMTKCDPPTSASKRSIAGWTGYPLDVVYYGAADIEEWIYDLGPTSLVMYLTFTNGVLTRIESGEYGH